MRRVLAIGVVLGLTGLGLTGCSSGSKDKAVDVTLQEYSMVVHTASVPAGKVTLHVVNNGGITHELVIMRAASPSALPTVKKAGERSVGAIDEEAVPEADQMGEVGDVAAQASVTKSFTLPAGTYVMFCNIDTKNGDGTITNHFKRGMAATLTVT
jgi:hypothetical protein